MRECARFILFVCQKLKHTNCITFVIQATDYSLVISCILLVRHRCRINCAPIRVCGGRPTCTRVYDKNTNWFNLTLLGMRISTLHRLVTWIELKGLMRSNVNSIEVNPRTKHIKLHTQHTDTTQRKTRVCVSTCVCVWVCRSITLTKQIRGVLCWQGARSLSLPLSCLARLANADESWVSVASFTRTHIVVQPI